jgi:hypothetical protein
VTTVAPDLSAPDALPRRRAAPSYAHAHWYFLGALAAIVAGFWPSFFRPLGGGSPWHTIHGITATLWVVALVTQGWLAFPPALTRLYARVFEPQVDFIMALHESFVTVEVILVALIASDWRAGERRTAYPLSLAFFVVVHALMFPVSGTAAWKAFTDWYVTVPLPFS